MKEIKLAYSDLYNAGDLMNVDIVELLSGRKVKRTKTFCADMTAIGGALIGLQYTQDLRRRIGYMLLHPFYDKKPIYVWGSGFFYGDNPRGLYRTNLQVCALRGAKSQEKLRELTGVFYDVPLADGGLLVDMLIDEKPEKKYKIGLIPHMWHQEEPAVAEMTQQEGVHLINIRQTPQAVAKEILMCETVASTSLHGLIFADALGVPNLHIMGDADLLGGNFKFEDYYSSFGLEDDACILSEHIPTREEIIERYRISPEAVAEKKQALIDCFPKALKADK